MSKRQQHYNKAQHGSVAIVGSDGWTTCPSCGRRFATHDKNRWDGKRHKTCGAHFQLYGQDGKPYSSQPQTLVTEQSPSSTKESPILTVESEKKQGAISKTLCLISVPFAVIGHTTADAFSSVQPILSIFGEKMALLVGGFFGLLFSSIPFMFLVRPILEIENEYADILFAPVAITYMCALRGALLGAITAAEEKPLSSAIREASTSPFLSKRVLFAFLAIAGAMGVIALAAFLSER